MYFDFGADTKALKKSSKQSLSPAPRRHEVVASPKCSFGKESPEGTPSGPSGKGSTKCDEVAPSEGFAPSGQLRG